MLRFDITSNYGWFFWEKTRGDYRMTRDFISRTEILGILGAVLGLDGYNQIKIRSKLRSETNVGDNKSFYKVLNGLKVGIVPKKEPKSFEDHLIHRHMRHINKLGALQGRVMVLIQPSFEVYLQQGECDDETYQTLCGKLKRGECSFIPYMGVNQYPLDIYNVESVENYYETKKEGAYRIDSLVRKNDVQLKEEVTSSNIGEDSSDFHYIEQLKDYKKDEVPEIENHPTYWSSYEMKVDKSIVFLDQGKEADSKRVVLY